MHHRGNKLSPRPSLQPNNWNPGALSSKGSTCALHPNTTTEHVEILMLPFVTVLSRMFTNPILNISFSFLKEIIMNISKINNRKRKPL